jgi:type III secretion protein T
VLLYLDYLPSLMLGMARIYPCAMLVAAFCFQHIRGMPRHTIVMVMALLPAPGIHAALAGHDYSALMLGALALKELALGLLLGVLLSMPFWMFESVGALLDNQRRPWPVASSTLRWGRMRRRSGICSSSWRFFC